jgi:hypothetical protein
VLDWPPQLVVSSLRPAMPNTLLKLALVLLALPLLPPAPPLPLLPLVSPLCAEPALPPKNDAGRTAAGHMHTQGHAPVVARQSTLEARTVSPSHVISRRCSVPANLQHGPLLRHRLQHRTCALDCRSPAPGYG